MQSRYLLQRCAIALAGGAPYSADVELVSARGHEIAGQSSRLTERFLATPISGWDGLIADHAAHKHSWYDYIAEEITIDEMAVFLLENVHYPVFLRLLETIRSVQFIDDAVAAVDENIADENEPEPHAELMRRMMNAVSDRARHPLPLEEYPSLVDRTLVFYYGCFVEPWHLVGSVFATERMGTRRVQAMYQGLKRLGLTDHELAFAIIHSECDEHHAGDWLERVIEPSVAERGELRAPVASGIAACLETSRVYLDYLVQRAELRSARRGETEQEPISTCRSPS